MNPLMPRPAPPLRSPTGGNPFPGIAALERSTGLSIKARLSANEALPLYSETLAARYGHALLEEARRYPDPSAYELREAIAGHHGLSVENTLVDAGADALIFLFLRAFADPGSVVIHAAGTYPTVGYFCRSMGLRPYSVSYTLSGGTARVDLARLASEARHQQARVVYLANPDNPTGSEHDWQALKAFAAMLPVGTLLILDEAYEAFGTPRCASPLPNAVRLRSFSKAYGLAGMRVGYAIAPPQLLEVAQRARVHYGVGTVAQSLALAALEDQAHHRSVIATTQALKARFIERAQASGLRWLPSATNFVTVRLPHAQTGETLRARLLARGASLYLGQLNGCVPIARVSLQPELFAPALADIIFRSEGCSHDQP